MKAEPTGELPHPLDRVQLWTVRREKIQAQSAGVARSPLFVENGVMVLRVVRYHDRRSTASPCNLLQGLQELKEGGGVEALILAAEYQLPISQANCAKVPNATPSRIVQEGRLLDLRGNPHSAAGAMLLEVHLIERPKVHFACPHEGSEFFLCWV